ncbi:MULTISPECIES: helix-turn-helix domain-containing protein [Thermodesulfovibrio]|jgi:cytoskeletal protein RodZ|uniref:helix-turn-helix domain-containing protein n=1 Tax=Thermodesulfovibrio TaxID=28261 RepID=UPI00261AA421|nr:helix-turn-helix domain-containing protein [Thermodesulfovibrio sp.]
MHEEFKKKRIELNKSLEEISEHTKIKKCCLKAIEDGNFEELPVEVYARSYIKTYAQYLKIDPTEILKEYDKFLEKKQTSQKPEVVSVREIPIKEEKKNKKVPKGVSTALIIGAALLLIIILLNIEKKEYTPPSLNLQKQVTLEDAKKESKDEQINKKNENMLEQKTLKIEATDKVWMRITIDEKEKKEFFLNPGQSLELKATKSFKLHIGNAGGVKIVFDNKEFEKLGETGQVVYLNLPQDRN